MTFLSESHRLDVHCQEIVLWECYDYEYFNSSIKHRIFDQKLFRTNKLTIFDILAIISGFQLLCKLLVLLNRG